jgi:hypothetical protein
MGEEFTFGDSLADSTHIAAKIQGLLEKVLDS